MGVTREKLYEEVSAEPMTAIGKRYGVSSSFLARVCERLKVPRPPRGYWAQRAVGIKVAQARLPTADPGAELEWVRDGSQPKRQPMVAPSLRPRRAKQNRSEKHPLLQGAREHYDHADVLTKRRKFRWVPRLHGGIAHEVHLLDGLGKDALEARMDRMDRRRGVGPLSHRIPRGCA
ncbi:MAG TPA: hypothetical protein VK550_16420 [Polyangiaceae bacterium]|nr:hypothetical protein [Polyangiaceae bacterium]